MDQADIADKVITDYLERAIAAARGITTSSSSHLSSAVNCIDCGEEIPDKRRNIIQGCKRCISCEEDHELRNKSCSVPQMTTDIAEEAVDDILFAPL